MLRIGYACETVGVYGLHYARIKKASVTSERLHEVIRHNLDVLEAMIDYNARIGITLFRITSDLIPFATDEVNSLPWWEIYQERFRTIGAKLSSYAIRFSFHPGPYTVLNSPHPNIVAFTTKELEYHQRLIDLLGGDTQNKIVIHVGGVYQNKEASMKRFIENYRLLPLQLQRHLALENDEFHYGIEDVLAIAKVIQIPIIFDYFHHQLFPGKTALSLDEIFRQCRATWHHEDGVMKVHYSEPDQDGPLGTHSTSISSATFLKVWRPYQTETMDIMLEVKDKNLSALKCRHLLQESVKITTLEKVWAHYKYLVLEHSAAMYQDIRSLLKEKDHNITRAFYDLIERALSTPVSQGSVINAYQHVAGYFKHRATDKEKAQLILDEEALYNNLENRGKIKAKLLKLAAKYGQTYLLSSYYLYLNGTTKVNH